ncbi:MAG: methyltransferase domain-containing protein [Dehalococcoidia bacterium]
MKGDSRSLITHGHHTEGRAKRQSASELNRSYYDQQASEYDECVFIKARDYGERYNVILSLMAVSGAEEGPFLELGVGTGTLAARVLERFPSARLDGYDVSKGMLEEARQKLARYGERARLFQKDITTDLPLDRYQVIYTSSTIHHLPNRERPRLFHRLYPLLRPGGCLIVSDRFEPDTEELAGVYEELQRRDFQAQGLDLKEYEAEKKHGDHLGASLTRYPRYLSLMRKAGFVNVDCVYKYLGAAVIYGQRPSD